LGEIAILFSGKTKSNTWIDHPRIRTTAAAFASTKQDLDDTQRGAGGYGSTGKN
jgi:dUTPase